MIIFITLLRREGPEARARELLKDNLSIAASLIRMRTEEADVEEASERCWMGGSVLFHADSLADREAGLGVQENFTKCTKVRVVFWCLLFLPDICTLNPTLCAEFLQCGVLVRRLPCMAPRKRLANASLHRRCDTHYCKKK